MVRKTVSEKVPIANPTDKEWAIRPTISTADDSIASFFKGDASFVIPAKGSADFEITYSPSKMTIKKKEESKEGEEEKEEIELLHEATLFFPLPDGTAKQFKLSGRSLPPESQDQIQVECQAKKGKYISIPVENWLKTSQRFKVSWEIEGEQEKTTFIRAASTFDIAGSSTKDYKINFLAYKEGETTFVVTFKNQDTGEFLFYNVKVTAQDPGVLNSFELACSVREKTTAFLPIENPTEEEVEINALEFSFENENITISPDTIKIPPKSEKGFTVTFRPLIVEEEQTQLVLRSGVLGEFKYDF